MGVHVYPQMSQIHPEGAEAIVLGQNRGKGDALRVLLAEARRRGFSAAVAVDAALASAVAVSSISVRAVAVSAAWLRLRM